MNKASAEKIPGTKAIAERLVRGEEAFVATLMSAGEISRNDAERVFQTYRKLKAVKRDFAFGTWTVVHGGFLDREVILRALAR